MTEDELVNKILTARDKKSIATIDQYLVKKPTAITLKVMQALEGMEMVRIELNKGVKVI